jgi:hypothetical protein
LTLAARERMMPQEREATMAAKPLSDADLEAIVCSAVAGVMHETPEDMAHDIGLELQKLDLNWTIQVADDMLSVTFIEDNGAKRSAIGIYR